MRPERKETPMIEQLESFIGSNAPTCSGLADSLADLCEYLAEKSKEHQALASLTGYSVTGDAMAAHQKEWVDTLDSWIAQIKVLAPKCKLCGDRGYYDGGIYDGEPCRICSQNASVMARPDGGPNQ